MFDPIKAIVDWWEEGAVKPEGNLQTEVTKDGAVMKPRASMSGTMTPLFSSYFNGEKNYGEMGPIRNYLLDYDGLRSRSWQLILDSEIAQTVIKKYTTWMIGGGLSLQSEPSKRILESEGIKINYQEFSKTVESRFSTYSKSRISDYSGMTCLDMMEAECLKNALVGGDMLVILRLIDGYVKVQMVDGVHVTNPLSGSDFFPRALANGNRIINGVEINKQGKHVAYYVRNLDKLSANVFDTSNEITRLRAETPNGLQMCFLVYGSRYRLDNHRGMPLLSATFETIKKLERYKEATVGSAEERQKIPFSVEHDIFSDGENPFTAQTMRAYNIEAGNGDIPIDVQGQQVADRVMATTNKQVFNMPLGAHLKALESKNELYFKDFYGTNSDGICATIEMPPNVAFSQYNDSFSASRAALKDWENTLVTKRQPFSFQFKARIYHFWLECEILQGKIQAPGYLKARQDGNEMVVAAYRCARFVGPQVPHIDPVKEVTAERLKLGDTGASIPLTTAERATEVLNGGEFDSNLEQYAEELQSSKDLGIEVEIPVDPNKKPVPDKED